MRGLRLSPPKFVVWCICLACLIVGILLAKGILTFSLAGINPGAYSFWIEAFGLGLMLLATIVDGL